MAKHMVEKESDPIKIFANFFTKLAEKAGRTAARRKTTTEGERSKFIERATNLGKEPTPEELQKAKVSAKQITEKLRSGNRPDVEEAENFLKASGPLAGTIEESLQLKREALMFAEIRGDAPTWLTQKIPEVQQSGAAAELVANVVFLPNDLRDDPFVLYEAVRRADLVFDVKSATSEAISEYVHVRRTIVEHIRERAQTLSQSGENTALLDGYSNDGIFGEKFDLYRSKKLDEKVLGKKPQKRGRMTDEEKENYNELMKQWVEESTPALQRRDLDGDLGVWQGNIDAGRYIDNRDEIRELSDFERKLKNGKEMRSKSEEGVSIRRSAYAPEEADEYLDRVLQRKQIVAVKINAERASMEQDMQQRRVLEHRAARESDFSSLYVSPGEKDKFRDNPAIFLHEKLDNAEREAETGDINGTMFQANMGRLKLAGEMLGSDEFIETIRKEYPNDRAIAEFVSRIDPMDKAARRELSQSIAARIDAIYLNYALSNSSDLEKFGESMQRFGDRGILVLGSGEGGLVGDWASRYEATLNGIVGNNARLYTQHEAMATRITVEQLLAERDTAAYYKEFYKKYQIPGKELPVEYKTMSNGMAESIIRRAKIVSRLRMRKPVMMEQGLAPGDNEWEFGQSSYATLGIEEQMLGAARIRDWFMRKWGNRTEFLLVWNTGALFTAKADKRLWKYVQEQTKQLWVSAHLDDTADNAVVRNKALERLATLIHFNEPHESVQDIVSPFDSNNQLTWKGAVLNRMRTMKPKDFERLVAVEEGGFRMQRMLRPYFYMDSLWREHEFRGAIEKAFTHSDKMFLGARLRARGEKFFFHPITPDRGKAEAELVEELIYVAKYRPQGIADFLRHSNDTELQQWYDANKGNFGAVDLDIHKTFGELNRRFIMINQRIIRDNAEPIDYTAIDQLLNLARMSPDARAAELEGVDIRTKTWWMYLEKVFATEDSSSRINTPERYLFAMKSLSAHLTENGFAQIKKSTGVRYDRYFLHMAWEDDMPAHLLEDVRNINNINPAYLKTTARDSDGKPMPISHKLTSHGTGPGSPAKRAWTDFKLAIDTMNAFTDFNFSADEKEFLKLCFLMNKNIGVYQGPYLASEAVLKFTASWLGSAQVKAEYGDFLTGLFDSSVFKEARGSNAPSLSLDKVHEVFEEVEKVVGRLDTEAPQAHHAIERFLRISTVHMMGKEVRIPYLFEEGISWHELFKHAKDIPVLRNVVESKLLRSLDKSSPLGLSTYKLLLGAGLITAIVVATTGAELKNEGKDKHSG